MFSKSADERMAAWLELRKQIESSDTPFELIIEFWSHAPFIPYNRLIDPYNQTSWPTPWEILVENKYDDFTIALMMAYSVKYTKRFNKSSVEIRSYFTESKSQMFNLVCIDQEVVLNYMDKPTEVRVSDIPDTLSLDNIVLIKNHS
jgi:hypothetical protein